MWKYLSTMHNKELKEEKEKEAKKTREKRTLTLLSTTKKTEKVAMGSSKQLTLQKALDQHEIWDTNG